MPHITTLIKPSGKLSSLLPMRRSATWFLARASRQSSGPSSCLSSPPWLGRDSSRMPTEEWSRGALWWEGEVRGSASKRHLQTSMWLLLDCMFIWVQIGDAHSVQTKSTSSGLCQCFQKSFSHIPITIREIETIPIAFEVSFKHLQLKSRFI